VVRVYLKYLDHENDYLRYDALMLFGSVSEATEHMATYRRCLNDEVPHIRTLALERLYEVGRDELLGFKEEIENMLSDPDMDVKRAAIKILKKLNRDSGIFKDVKKENSL
jgi:HEAT repeat protein